MAHENDEPRCDGIALTAVEDISEFGRWIAENESLLSGLVSLVVLIGLVLSPFGKGVRRLLSRAEPDPARRVPLTDAALEERCTGATEPLIAVLAFDNLSWSSGSRRPDGPIAPTKCPTTSGQNARGQSTSRRTISVLGSALASDRVL